MADDSDTLKSMIAQLSKNVDQLAKAREEDRKAREEFERTVSTNREQDRKALEEVRKEDRKALEEVRKEDRKAREEFERTVSTKLAKVVEDREQDRKALEEVRKVQPVEAQATRNGREASVADTAETGATNTLTISSSTYTKSFQHQVDSGQYPTCSLSKITGGAGDNGARDSAGRPSVQSSLPHLPGEDSFIVRKRLAEVDDAERHSKLARWRDHYLGHAQRKWDRDASHAGDDMISDQDIRRFVRYITRAVPPMLDNENEGC